MNFLIERWQRIPKLRKLKAGAVIMVAIILVAVISQRLATFAEILNTVSNVASLNYNQDDQTKTAQSNTVLTEIVGAVSPSPSATPTATVTPTPTATATATPTVSPTATPSPTPTPTPTPTVVKGGGGGGGGGGGTAAYNYKMALVAKLAAVKKTLMNAKLALIMKLKGKQNKLGAPTIDYVNISTNPAQVGQEMKFEIGWTDPGDQVKIYVCKANLMFNRACAKAYWCEYGPKDSSPAWCYYTPQLKDNYFNYFYIFACDAGGQCSLGQAGNFRVNR